MIDATQLERRGWIPKKRRYDHEERRRMRRSPARIKWLAGARRSGKTIDAIDYILLGHGPRNPKTGLPKFAGVLTVSPDVDNPTFVVAGPTYGMLRKIWWGKLKRRIPPWMLIGKPSETEMTMRFVNGATLYLIGLNDPQRAEGIEIDGLVVDEFAYVKINAWKQSLRPALSTPGRPPGWAILQGKPAGRNHFWKGWQRARDGQAKNHDAFHWKSSVVMRASELAQAQVDLDPASFRQEYEASFETYSGRAYYTFGAHNRRRCEWDPKRPIAFAWDFGTSPGTVAVCQIHDLPATHCLDCGREKPASVPLGESWPCQSCRQMAYALIPCLVIIDEAYEAIGSTTNSLCDRLTQKWAERIRATGGRVLLYGDPAGWAAGTRSKSSDWDTIVAHLSLNFDDIRIQVDRQQPPQRDRVNALTRLCMSTSGLVRLFVDPENAPHSVDDFENTALKENGSGEIDKKAAGGLYSHLTDAVAYLALREFPLKRRSVESEVVGT